MTFFRVFISSAIVLFLLASNTRGAEPIPLRAGPVTMVFDVDNVFLRYVRVGSHEVLRGITAPVRDQNWATVAPKVANLRVDHYGGGFQVTFDVLCQEADIDFRWKGSISGNAKGEIEYAFDGEAHSTFKRNRIGFCVLHGPSAAGQPWVIETADGKSSSGQFPKFISPHQPAKNLRAITHEVASGIRARVDFEGEVFEMEDQRNWTDASFKTYCIPLERPYPVEVPKGTKVSQKIKIRLAGNLPNNQQSQTDGAVLTLTDKESVLPRIGAQVSGEVQDLTDLQVQRLKDLKFDHLRIDLALSNKTFVKDLQRATKQAKAVGVSLHVGLNLGKSPDFATLLDEIKKLDPLVSYWLITGGDPDHFQQALKQLESAASKAKIGVTQTTNFVDLNRARPEDAAVEAVGFAINPQIHAFDNSSMVETLSIHADVVNSARQFTRNRPLIIGPMTLRPQLVNGIAPPGGPPASDPLPTFVDARQGSPFAAAWTLGSIKYLAESGAYSATFYETVGWNGIMDANNPPPRPKAYPSRPGELFPVYHLLKEVGEFAGGQVRQIDSSDALTAVGIALSKNGRKRMFIANLIGGPQTITIKGFDGKSATVQVLGAKETTAHKGSDPRVSLPPYGIARLDL